VNLYNFRIGTCVRNSNIKYNIFCGRWESFQQSRSFGAHGMNSTQLKVSNHDLHRHLNNLLHSTNIYHVYTLDFQREVRALRACQLREQPAAKNVPISIIIRGSMTRFKSLLLRLLPQEWLYEQHSHRYG
jgi:hypothetical protein